MIIILLVIGAALLVGSVALRKLTDGQLEIKTTDLVFLVIPLILFALATGKIKGIDMFGVKADLSTIWTEAAGENIEREVSTTPLASVDDAVEMMEMAQKRGVEDLPELIRRRVEALEFRLGTGGYYAPAIRMYFESLSNSSYLRAIVVNEQNGTLFGVYKATDLIAYLRVPGADFSGAPSDRGYDEFQNLLNRSSDTSKERLAELPGFVSSALAVKHSITKRDALAQMEKHGFDSLPVVDDQSRFIGMIDRSSLTTSLVLAVTDKLEGRDQENRDK